MGLPKNLDMVDCCVDRCAGTAVEVEGETAGGAVEHSELAIPLPRGVTGGELHSYGLPSSAGETGALCRAVRLGEVLVDA